MNACSVSWLSGPKTDDRVRGLVLTGSGGSRTAHPLSDRDIEVYTTRTDDLLSDETWWSRFGEVLVVERLHDADGYPTRRIYYAGGKLDFTIIPSARLGSGRYLRPFEILLDKNRAATRMRQAPRGGAYWYLRRLGVATDPRTDIMSLIGPT